MNKKWLGLIVAAMIVTFAVGGRAGRPAVAEQTIGLYVDGQVGDFRSHVVSTSFSPVLVDSHAMIPVRFLDEVLRVHLDLHLQQWGILRVGGLAFKLGVKEVCWPVPSTGGDRRYSVPLPVAPRIINGRYYVPARTILNLLGHGVEWDGTKRALRISRNAAAEKLGTSLAQALSQEGTVKKVDWLLDGDLSRPSGLRGAVREIGDIRVEVKPLVIRSIRKFADVSSHFVDSPMAKEDAFMYAGTDTAGIPMTTRPLTLFDVYCGKTDAQVTLHPEKARLLDGLGHELIAVQSERIYMSCPGWEFPLWRQEHNAIFGFLVFPHLDDRCVKVTLKLPYAHGDKQGTAVYEFGRRVLQEDVPRESRRTG